MFIDGFAISGYRSFGKDFQRIGPCKKVNLIAGQNNSGKSNILLFLSKELSKLRGATSKRAADVELTDIDRHHGEAIPTRRFELGLTINGLNHRKIIERCKEKFGDLPSNYGQVDRDRSLNFVDQLLNSPVLKDSAGVTWFPYVAPTLSNDVFKIPRNVIDALYADRANQEYEILHTWQTLNGSKAPNGHIPYIDALTNILNFVAPHHLEIPKIHLIPAIRRIGEVNSKYEDFSGIGIISRLHHLQNPEYNQQHLKEKFREINDFLRNLTGNPTAQLEIPHNETGITVYMDGRALPLTSLGTGIHEVIILAAAATVVENEIICIEEPELHLHPLLQRKLIRYLTQHTNNQYFITTHSANLLDAPEVQLSHVRHEDGRSNIASVTTPAGRSAICADLGYRASDLVQANSVIWVEGPSDRIYLNYWIAKKDPDLVEGLHYSIMFYGGRLLSHLSANDPEIDDFISLRRLNRYICIMMDSDKENAQTPINETKGRLETEFNQGPGFAWVTEGREVENYFDGTELEEVVLGIHNRSAVSLEGKGNFERQSYYISKKGETTEIDKVKVARKVVADGTITYAIDPDPQIDKLVAFIREANEHLDS